MGFESKKNFSVGDEVVVTVDGKELAGEVIYVSIYSEAIDVKINGIELSIKSDSAWDVKVPLQKFPTGKGAVIKPKRRVEFIRANWGDGLWISSGNGTQYTEQQIRDSFPGPFEVLYAGREE